MIWIPPNFNFQNTKESPIKMTDLDLEFEVLNLDHVFVLMTSTVECLSIPTIDTRLIDTSVDIPLTSRLRVDLFSSELVNTRPTINGLLIKCQLGMNQDTHLIWIQLLTESIDR